MLVEKTKEVLEKYFVYVHQHDGNVVLNVKTSYCRESGFKRNISFYKQRKQADFLVSR